MTPGNAADCEPSVTQLEGTRVGANNSPTVRRRRLGMELRRLREEANKQLEEVAELLECSPSKVSRMETGRVPIRARDVRDLLKFYGVPEEVHGHLLELARGSREKGWWHQYKEGLREQFPTYLGLEADASALYYYEAQLVPGLLQIEAYTRIVIRADFTSSTEIGPRVAVRMARQQLLLEKEDPLQIWAIVDEAALKRTVGGHKVMCAQLDHLVHLATLPNITIQILPFSAGAHRGIEGSFTILEFSDPAISKVVYLEGMTSDLYLERPREIDQYALAFDHLRATALSVDESVAMITKVAAEFREQR